LSMPKLNQPPASQQSHQPQVWWVNQGSTFRVERAESFIWAPQRDRRGRTPPHWGSMQQVLAGDIILHYANGALHAVSKVQDDVEMAPKPKSLSDQYPDGPGWLVRTQYHDLHPPIKREQINIIPALRQQTDGPITKEGYIKQGYLFPLSQQALAAIYEAVPSSSWPDFVIKICENAERVPSISAQLVASISEVADNIRRFHHEVHEDQTPAHNLPIKTDRYFAYDPISGWFAPAKFAGIANMTLSTYQQYVNGQAPAIFDGSRTKKALEEICGPLVTAPEVLKRFRQWLEKWGLSYREDMKIFAAGEIEEPPVLDIFCTEIKNMKLARDKANNKPYRYKPLMLLAAVQTLVSGHTLSFGPPLLDHYYHYLAILGSTVRNANLPYYHLMSEGFWQILRNGTPISFDSGREPNSLRGTTVRIVGRRQECITDPYLRPYVLEAIKTHFDPDEWQRLQSILPAGESPAPYLPSGEQRMEQQLEQQLEQQMDDSGKEHEKTAAGLIPPQSYPVASMPEDWDWTEAMQRLIAYLSANGFYFEPWQVAAYITALRTKPFVILAGISGTGKTKLPRLVAQACGIHSVVIPVRPDWTDSSDLLGYTDLQGKFRPGALLEFARQAAADLDHPYVIVLDEMNLARVEHYLAEVLSRIEERRITAGRWLCDPLLASGHHQLENEVWRQVALPPNLAIVGTVNMDESTHSFSRKVLDRAFTLEMSDVDLSVWGTANSNMQPQEWPVGVLAPRYTSLVQIPQEDAAAVQIVKTVNETLTILNQHLRLAQLQVGYRVRDEIALFMLNAKDVADFFRTKDDGVVAPLDLALSMKILPRIVGGSGAVRRTLAAILGWSEKGVQESGGFTEEDADTLTAKWINSGRPGAMPDAAFPRSAARACLMWERLNDDGFTSYWL